MRLRVLPSFVLAAVVVVAPAAHAATITQTFTQPALSDWELPNIQFNQFNPVLGTLNSATLAFNSTLFATVTVGVPVTAQTQNATSYEAFIDVVLYGGASYTNELTSFRVTATPLTAPGVSLAPGRSQTFSDSSPAAFGPASQLPLAQFIGTGTRSYSIIARGGDVFIGGPQVTITEHNWLLNGTLSLVYDYTPARVPEPSSMLLLGAAAMAGIVKRLRRQ